MSRTQPQTEAPPFHAVRISADLQDRHVGGLISIPGRVWRLIHLHSGAAQIQPQEDDSWISGPAVMWLPWSEDMRLRIRAGTSGAMIVMSEQMLANTLGHKPEAADLRQMLQRPVHADLSQEPDIRKDIDQGFAIVLREASAERPGAATLIEAQCRILAVRLWRLFLQSGSETTPVTRERRELQVFRALMETQFRNRWTVRAYADEMGMSPDRLHDLCHRALGRPPSALIRERLAYEAQLLMLRSNQPLGQIAGQLGFVDAPQFSKFFRQEFGEPPGQYRRRNAAERARGEARDARTFSDWP